MHFTPLSRLVASALVSIRTNRGMVRRNTSLIPGRAGIEPNHYPAANLICNVKILTKNINGPSEG